VAGRPARLDPIEERVAIAIEADLDHPLGIAARCTLAPELAAGARVVVCLTNFHSLFNGFAVGVGEHENLAGAGVLSDHGYEAVVVIAYTV
jgi:hypothetical protein